MSFFENISSIQNIIYIFSSILFISGIKMLGKEDTAVRGNFLSALAMFIAVSVTFINVTVNPILVLVGIGIGAIIGSLIALKVKMTSIPEMVALFNGFGGLATFFIAWSEFNSIPSNNFQYLFINDYNLHWRRHILWKCYCLWQIIRDTKGRKVLDNYKIIHNFILHFNYIFVVLNFYNKDFQSRL